MIYTDKLALKPWIALALCFIASVIIFIPYVGYSTKTTEIMADLSMDYTMAGTLASVTALAGGLVVYSAGGLLNRWGARKVCVAGLIASAAGQCLFASVHTYHAMLFTRMLQGAMIPLLFVGPYTLVMYWAEQSKRLGVFMGVMLATDGIGTVVAGYVYSNILSAWGWRAGSLWGAGALLAIAVLLWAILEEPTPQMSGKKEAGTKTGSQMSKYGTVIRERNVIVAALFLTGVWGSYSVAIYWVPILLIEEAHWSANAAGFAGALYPLAGVVSAVSCGLLSDRLGRRKPLMLISGFGMMLAFAGAAIAVGEGRFDIVALTFPIGGIFAYIGLPLGYCIAADAVGIELAGTATGCIMGTGLLMGGVCYPLVLGYLRDATGLYTLGFALAAASLFLCNFVAVMFGRDIPTHDCEAEEVMLERAVLSPSSRM